MKTQTGMDTHTNRPGRQPLQNPQKCKNLTKSFLLPVNLQCLHDDPMALMNLPIFNLMILGTYNAA